MGEERHYVAMPDSPAETNKMVGWFEDPERAQEEALERVGHDDFKLYVLVGERE